VTHNERETYTLRGVEYKTDFDKEATELVSLLSYYASNDNRQITTVETEESLEGNE